MHRIDMLFFFLSLFLCLFRQILNSIQIRIRM